MSRSVGCWENRGRLARSGRVIRDNLRRMHTEILKLFQAEEGRSNLFSIYVFGVTYGPKLPALLMMYLPDVFSLKTMTMTSLFRCPSAAPCFLLTNQVRHRRAMSVGHVSAWSVCFEAAKGASTRTKKGNMIRIDCGVAHR